MNHLTIVLRAQVFNLHLGFFMIYKSNIFRLFCSLCFFILCIGQLSAQEVISSRADEEHNDDLYEKEIVFGLNMNNWMDIVGGLNFKYVKKKEYRRYHGINLDILYIKHPKETTVYISNDNSKSYIPNKMNHLMILRPIYQREYILFRKAREQGVQVNLLFGAGPSIGLVTPCYVNYSVGSGPNKTGVQGIDDISPANIIGSESYFRSLSDSEVEFGLSGKLAMSFEFGMFNESVSGFEIGAAADYFPNGPIMLMHDTQNYSVFPMFYLTFYYGVKK